MLKVTRRFAVLLVFVFLAAPVEAAVTGQVIDAETKNPVEGARVRIQTKTGEPYITGADGQFEVDMLEPGEFFRVTAVVSYSSENDINYIVGDGGYVGDGATDVVIELMPLQEHDATGYQPHDNVPPGTCGGCHFEHGPQWQGSAHSNAAANQWVLDLFADYRATHDEDDTGLCATCHAPLEDRLALETNPDGAFLDEVSEDSYGVSCLACHQMAEVDPDAVSELHHRGNAEYYFTGSDLSVWGPLDDVVDVMSASFQPQFSEAVFCASCHEYDNPRNPGIPGQTTYSEWLASPYGPDGLNQPCQSCHMEPADTDGQIGSGGPSERPAEQRHDHHIIGATEDTLQQAVSLDMQVARFGEELVVAATVSNHGAGHAFPTGVSIRNAILVIEAVVDGQSLAQTAGPVVPFYGSAEGGDGPDDLAGAPGRGFARVLEGEVGGERKYPVLFIDADTVREDTRILPGTHDRSHYRFDLSAAPENATVEIEARLLYRRAWRDLVERMEWETNATGGPIEIEIHTESESLLVQDLPVEPFFSDRFEDLGN